MTYVASLDLSVAPDAELTGARLSPAPGSRLLLERRSSFVESGGMPWARPGHR